MEKGNKGRPGQRMAEDVGLKFLTIQSEEYLCRNSYLQEKGDNYFLPKVMMFYIKAKAVLKCSVVFCSAVQRCVVCINAEAEAKGKVSERERGIGIVRTDQRRRTKNKLGHRLSSVLNKISCSCRELSSTLCFFTHVFKRKFQPSVRKHIWKEKNNSRDSMEREGRIKMGYKQ